MKFLSVLIAVAMFFPLTAVADGDTEAAEKRVEDLYRVDGGDLPPTDVLPLTESASGQLASALGLIENIELPDDPRAIGKLARATQLEMQIADYLRARRAREMEQSKTTITESGALVGAGGTAPDNVYLISVYGRPSDLTGKVLFNGRYHRVKAGSFLAPGVAVESLTGSYMDLSMNGQTVRVGLTSFEGLQSIRRNAEAVPGDPGGFGQPDLSVQPLGGGFIGGATE